MPIHQLSVQLANQIAAGEVVERPASVVKELLENAVDAHASRIVLEVYGGGRTIIRVRDNGSGIPKDELPLALAPHATSKISSVEDLAQIATLGFRGEALASIAAVSKLTLTSRPAGQEQAYSVHTEGPMMEAVIEPAAHPQGTTVEVRELFFNTPARRRFLRSERTELTRIKDIWLRTALSWRAIAFELIFDGRTVASLPAVPEGNDEAYRRRVGKLIGAPFVQEALELKVEGGPLTLHGLLLPPPQDYESAPENIYLFLNGRAVADKLLVHALREAYREAAGSTAAVRALIFAGCDPREVDINVHPRKDEVRFHDARAVHDILTDAVVNLLLAQRVKKNEQEQSSLFPAQSAADPAAKGLEGGAADPGSADGAPPAQDFTLTGQKAEPQAPQLPKAQPAPQTGPSAAVPSAAAIAQFNSAAAAAAGERALSGLSSSTLQKLSAALKQRSTPVQPAEIKPSPAEPAAQRRQGEELLAPKEQLASEAERLRQQLTALKPALPVRPPLSPALSLSTLQGAALQDCHVTLLDRPQPQVLLLKADGRYFLARLSALQLYVGARALQELVQTQDLPGRDLTLPFRLRADAELVRALKLLQGVPEMLGFKLSLKRESIELYAVPVQLSSCDLALEGSRVLHLAVAAGKDLQKRQCPRRLAEALVKAAGFPHVEPAALTGLLQQLPSADLLAGIDGVSELLIVQWARQLAGEL